MQNSDSNFCDGGGPLRQLLAGIQAVNSNKTWLSYFGQVTMIADHRIVVAGLSQMLRLGDKLRVKTDQGHFDGEVIRIEPDHAIVTMYQSQTEVTLNAQVEILSRPTITPDDLWLGRVMNPLCEPIDGKGALLTGMTEYPIEGSATRSLDRARLGTRINSGIRLIDIFTPLCDGQRIGIFAGTGIGKTTLLGMLAKNAPFDVIVVALVGERGREVREFVEDILGESLRNCVVVVSTSDETPLMRRRAPMTAACIAEYFRDQGKRVGLIIDSLARFAQADRDVRIAAGELPVSRGYPPTVMSAISRLVERAGPGRAGVGTITAFYTVLVEGNDHDEPVSDQARGSLDGHIVLSKEIAESGRYPAVDIPKSQSRIATSLYTSQEAEQVAKLRQLIIQFENSEDLRAIGAYAAGSNPLIDRALKVVPKLYRYLSQGIAEPIDNNPFDTVAALLNDSASPPNTV